MASDACKKDQAHAKRKSDEALGLDMTSESLIDPQYKKKWDKYFSQKTETRIRHHDKWMEEQIRLTLVQRDIENIIFSELLRKQHA